MGRLTRFFNFLVAICAILAGLCFFWFIGLIFFRACSAPQALSYVLGRLAGWWNALKDAVTGLFLCRGWLP